VILYKKLIFSKILTKVIIVFRFSELFVVSCISLCLGSGVSVNVDAFTDRGHKEQKPLGETEIISDSFCYLR
jgi:hypothetical protein